MNTSSKSRLSQNITASANKLKLDSLNKILKIDSSKSKKHRRESLAKQVSRVALSDLIKNSSSPCAQDIPDFRTFLASKDNIEVFREFLKTQYCSENIDFYLACEKYRNLEPEKVGQELIKFMATQIYNDYLSKNARQPVNINYDCLQNIIRQMKNPGPDLLNDAQAEIYNLMRTDCYPRFCKTWRIDRETAKKILCERSILGSTTKTNTTATTLSIHDNTTTSLHSIPQSIASSRGTKRKLVFQPEAECPNDCPYYLVGLPCQQHVLDESKEEQRGKSDLIDRINLSRMHHVPDCCSRRTPPPPPLPPKPETKKLELSPVINKKYCPYVGKVFDV